MAPPLGYYTYTAPVAVDGLVGYRPDGFESTVPGNLRPGGVPAFPRPAFIPAAFVGAGATFRFANPDWKENGEPACKFTADNRPYYTIDQVCEWRAKLYAAARNKEEKMAAYEAIPDAMSSGVIVRGQSNIKINNHDGRNYTGILPHDEIRKSQLQQQLDEQKRHEAIMKQQQEYQQLHAHDHDHTGSQAGSHGDNGDHFPRNLSLHGPRLLWAPPAQEDQQEKWGRRAREEGKGNPAWHDQGRGTPITPVEPMPPQPIWTDFGWFYPPEGPNAMRTGAEEDDKHQHVVGVEAVAPNTRQYPFNHLKPPAQHRCDMEFFEHAGYLDTCFSGGDLDVGEMLDNLADFDFKNLNLESVVAGKNETWQRKYFKLDGACLQMFATKQKAEAHREAVSRPEAWWDARRIQRIGLDACDSLFSNGATNIRLYFKNGSMELRARSYAEAISWQRALGSLLSSEAVKSLGHRHTVVDSLREKAVAISMQADVDAGKQPPYAGNQEALERFQFSMRFDMYDVDKCGSLSHGQLVQMLRDLLRERTAMVQQQMWQQKDPAAMDRVSMELNLLSQLERDLPIQVADMLHLEESDRVDKQKARELFNAIISTRERYGEQDQCAMQ